MDIQVGQELVVVNAFGERVHRVATSPAVQGRDFEVVWVCSREEWDAAAREQREPASAPFPSEDVQVLARL